MPVIDANGLIDNRVAAIKAHHEACGLPRAELDLSGGLDSAVVLILCVMALGAENVVTVYSSIHSSPGSLERAREAAVVAGVELVELDLSAVFDSLQTQIEGAVVRSSPEVKSDLADDCIDAYLGAAKMYRERREADATIDGSFRSCIRAPIGRYINRLTGNGLRHGTGNECEDRVVRFYQKGGDGEVDLNVIGNLTKGEVYQLAIALGVPRSILTARPSPDLWGDKGHFDEDELSTWTGITPPAGMGWYSTVDPDTGEYTSLGLLERVARVDDLMVDTGIREDILPTEIFCDIPWYPRRQKRLLRCAHKSGAFPDTEFTGETVMGIIEALQRVERSTRHKENPNIPTLGTRRELCAAEVITDDPPYLPCKG